MWKEEYYFSNSLCSYKGCRTMLWNIRTSRISWEWLIRINIWSNFSDIVLKTEYPGIALNVNATKKEDGKCKRGREKGGNKTRKLNK